MYQNRITLIGFTGADAIARQTKNNRSYAVLTLATKASWRDRQSGEFASRTEWHRAIAWGKLGDFAKTLTKGAHVQLEGEVRYREYTDKQNVKRRVSEIHLDSILKLDRAERRESSEPTVDEPTDTPDEVPF